MRYLEQKLAAAKAFTLVELLVVIGIIALLISILLPSLNAARQQANTVKCLANLHSIGEAIAIYTVTSKGTLPYGFWQPDANDTTKSSDWAILLTATMGKGFGTYGTQNGSDQSKIQGMFSCPNAKLDGLSTTARKLHYSAHPRLMPDLSDPDYLRDSTGKTTLRPYKLGNIKRASDIVMIFDGSQCKISGYAPGDLDWNANAVAKNLDQYGVGGYQPPPAYGHVWNYLVAKAGADQTQAPYASNADAPPNTGAAFDIRWRHNRNDSANFLYADGHCGSFRLRFGQNADLKLSNIWLDTY